MKNKSTRHKEANTFKFQPFAERIANVDIDIFHRVEHENETQLAENECFFYQTIQKWDVLNLTEGYEAFRKEVRPQEVITLTQLLHRKYYVVEVLLKHLKYKNVLFLQPLLDLTVALAKDLGKEFYSYYPDFLSISLELLNTKDTEQLEWVFTCLAYLFKFLWRCLTKDISIVLNSLLPLLSDSKPEYINNFAAESFAFVARKVKDRRTFLSLILKSVKKSNDGISGCSKLLFEVLHGGVKGQFHSCAETMLPFLLESLSDEKLPTQILFDILKEVTNNITTNIQPQHGDLFWKTCYTLLNKLHDEWTEKHNDNVMNHIEMILKLIGQAVEFKSGKFLKDNEPLIQTLLKLITIFDLPEPILLIITQICILLLLSRNVRLSQEQASAVIRKVLAIDNTNIFLYFIDHISECTSFEALILPTFLKYCVANSLNRECLHVLTSLILKKAPLCGSGEGLSGWVKYPTSFGSDDQNLIVQNLLFEFLDNKSIEDVTNNSDNYLCSVIILPHLNLTNNEVVFKRLSVNIELLCGSLSTEKEISKEGMKKILFYLLLTMECATRINGFPKSIDSELIVDAVLPLCKDRSYLCALNILDVYLSSVQSDAGIISMANLKKLDSCLQENFSSPYHEVRLCTAHIYLLFEDIPELKSELITEDWKIFSICHDTESISADVQTYREQLKNLEKFTFDKSQISLCASTPFASVPLRYLCGVLYMNFRLLWDPTIDIIASHAQSSEINKFWSVFVEELKTASLNAKQPPVIEENVFDSSCVFLRDSYQTCYRLEVKPDFLNYRRLLWKAMTLFPEVAEAKTRNVSDLLLSFIEEEYMKTNSDVALVWNIKQNAVEIEPMEVDIEDKNDDETEMIKKELRKPAPTSGGKNKVKALIQHLQVFTKIRSPKSLYREPEICKLYLDMLSHRNPEVQRVALDCIMTYKHKYLVPYQQNLYNLIDDKNFKNELALFRIDKESSTVQQEHREDLIPVILKIVFSKMFTKTGLRTGGKSSGQLRRNLVLRFLAGCHENEMLSFITMSFKLYSKDFAEDPVEMVENISSGINLEKFVPPKRLQSSINLLGVVLERFGGLMGTEILKFLLKVILVVGSTIKGAIEQMGMVHAGYATLLRNLRTSCIKLVGRFFKNFESYPWTTQEVNAVFEAFVWPYLDRLEIEGIHSPTALLKLFITWGSQPKYFCLLVKHSRCDTSRYALPRIIKLLLHHKAHASVTGAIMEMVEKLLTLQCDEGEINLRTCIDDELPICNGILERLKVNEKLNYGSCILLPFVPSVLEKIQRKLNSKSKNVSQRELFVLSRISELVWEPDISDQILRLLLPLVQKKSSLGAGEETILRFVTTVHNLIQNVHEPHQHLKSLSPLFGDVVHVSSRKMLCQVLEYMAGKHDDENLKTTANLVVEINAWDAKWLDQPDFQRRLNCFKQIQNKIDDKTIDMELGTLIVLNCFNLIRNENDLSLRENAAHCWRTVACALVHKYSGSSTHLNYVLNDILFAIIRKGIRNKNEDVRNECISLLGCLARECPDAHTVLRDLNKLTNQVDLEVDFFENLMHLQLHRRARALLKFCQVFKQETSVPSPRTLTQFILPLTSLYLCTEKYAHKNSVVDAAIEVVGTVCKLLPWHQYEGVLKFYLDKLRKNKVEYQKQLVRIIVAVLDAFHFDLQKGHVNKLKDVKESLKEATIPDGQVVEGTEETSKIVQEEDGEQDENGMEAVENVDELEEIVGEENGAEEEEVVDVDVEENEATVVEIKAVEKINVLCKSTATRVIYTIQVVLLPQLHKTLAEMTHYESSHKVNRKRTGIEREEEDLSRVPISLAFVKLLQRLPKVILDANLPGVFMKLCTFLKSQLESVRRVTRETLQKITLTLGPQYLSLFLTEVRPLLSRGFQIHVLVYTVHSVLVSLKEMYARTDIDKILLTVIDLCKIDLFGSAADEKEVAKIGSKISEAKSTKSFDTLQILAQYMTETCLLDLIVPIKEVLAKSHSFKIVNKAQESLRYIALGLVDNQFISVESLLTFVYGTVSEKIPELITGKEKPVLTQKEKEKMERQKPDCFIIPAAPVGRSGLRLSNVKKSDKTNAHVLVEFGLKVCYFLLKREKLKDGDYRPFMDPLVGVFKNCLNSRHVKLSTTTLQCLSWFLKYDLPSLRENIKEITETIFSFLHKYAAAGLSKGDNFDLVVAAFKTMSVILRDVKYYTIETDQLKILLLYVEQDLYDHDRQATAFALLKAIISRKLTVAEINDVMTKISELSVTSELSHVRLQCRLVFHQYVMDYPLGNKLERHVAFYVSQLSYELQSGRESAVEMIKTFINSFPLSVLKEHSGMLLVTLGARLVNDDVPECRKMVADCLISMLTRLPRPDRDPLFDIIVLWLKDKKISHKRLAAQLCGIMVQVEKVSFETRILILLPVILSQFGLSDEENRPGRFVLLKPQTTEDNEEKERVRDHHLFQVLQMLLKICAQCPSYLKNRDHIEDLASHVQNLLGYPHEWVRLASAQFLGFVLSSLDIEHLAELLLTNKADETGYLYCDPQNGVKSLTLDLCGQLLPRSIKSDLAEQVIKNLVFVARVLQKVPFDGDANIKINLLWLAKRMRKIVNTEVVETPTSTVLRTEVFKWIAGVGTIIELDNLKRVLRHLLAPLVREMITTEESNAPLRQLSKEVGKLIKKRIGLEEYTNILSQLQQHLSVKRSERKRTRTQLAVTDPEMYAKKKIKRHEKKKEAKKRKIGQRKGVVRKGKKRKVVDLEDNSDII